ncbi:hypothetical protein [Povalibacter sp.]|uniref:hypothetical protein n=1 Tax=Povalibacter sp. TaxID=1962978 RepID=UPI002F401542
MDEYLFTVLAKLKADRLKLAREEQQRNVKFDAVDAPAHPSPRARRAPEPSADLLSIVSTHGLRGWS